MATSLQREGAISFKSLQASPFNSSFVFDGSNSDIAQQLYIRYKANDTSDRVNLTKVPPAVTKRLDHFNINFSTLPGLVQRAVLWDTGFAVAPGNIPVQIHPLKGYSMNNISVPTANVSFVDCSYLNCSQPNDLIAHYTQYCTGWQILNASRCVADTFKDAEADSYLGTMWSTGGQADMAPQIQVRDHKWTEFIAEFGGKITFSVYAVHTVAKELEPAWNSCLAESEYASLTVPCIPMGHLVNAVDYINANTTTPTGSDLVTNWLKEFAGTQSTPELAGSSGLLLLPIILGAIGAACCWLYWKRRAKLHGKPPASSRNNVRGSVGSALTPIDIENSMALRSFCTASPDYESAGSNKTLQILLCSEYLQGKRIPYENLAFESSVSKGASGEVWVCAYDGKQVAVKRLLPSKQQNADSVHTFAAEIELSATLVHPHIVEFVGVAWNTLNNLVMVLEYLPLGNLQNYLDKNAAQLSWARDKIHIAIGIAQALKYLHARTPPLIHRDLKSSNILLTATLEPKIIDFGVSRGRVEQTMTGGVGTPFWTAPEILGGNHYTEQADIFSFGVVLSELDTGKIPYHDAVNQDGTKLKPFQVLNQVISGTLRPSFTDDCPARIQRIGSACLASDPSDRPTAQQVLDHLAGRQEE